MLNQVKGLVALGCVAAMGAGQAWAGSSQGLSAGGSEVSASVGALSVGGSQALVGASAWVGGQAADVREALHTAAQEYRATDGKVGVIPSTASHVSALPVMVIESVAVLTTEVARVTLASAQRGAVVTFDLLKDKVAMPAARMGDRGFESSVAVSGNVLRTGSYVLLGVTDAGVVMVKDLSSASKQFVSADSRGSSQTVLGSLGNMKDAYGSRMARRKRN